MTQLSEADKKLFNITVDQLQVKVGEATEELITIHEKALPDRADAEIPEDLLKFLQSFAAEKASPNKDGHSSLIYEMLRIQHRDVNNLANDVLVRNTLNGGFSIPLYAVLINRDFIPGDVWSALLLLSEKDWDEVYDVKLRHEIAIKVDIHLAREKERLNDSEKIVSIRQKMLADVITNIEETEEALASGTESCSMRKTMQNLHARFIVNKAEQEGLLNAAIYQRNRRQRRIEKLNALKPRLEKYKG